MKKQCVFIDIDGTLFSHVTNQIPPSSIEALFKAKKRGHQLIICSGRPYPDLDESLLSLPVRGYILSCGAHIIMDGKEIFSSAFPQRELRSIASYMYEHDIGFVLEGKERNYLNKEAWLFFQQIASDHLTEQESETGRMLLKQKNMFPYDEIKEDDWNQLLKISIFSSDEPACRKLIAELPHQLHGFLHKNPQLSLINGEISVKGIHKAFGIDKVLAYLKHPLQQTIAIGDSMNDLEMLTHTAIGICMGNGDEQVKQAADHVTDPIDADGFLHAFQHYHLI